MDSPKRVVVSPNGPPLPPLKVRLVPSFWPCVVHICVGHIASQGLLSCREWCCLTSLTGLSSKQSCRRRVANASPQTHTWHQKHTLRPVFRTKPTRYNSCHQVAAINLKTWLNPKSGASEIVAASVVHLSGVRQDAPMPKVPI